MSVFRTAVVVGHSARAELVALASILATASVLRLLHLGSLPYGISGDEATVGLEGERILREGWIGPYSPYAAGQPAGVLYLTSVPMAALGKSFLGLRLVPALAGILTVAALYVVVRRNVGVVAAITAATLLAASSWAIHFSRFALPLGVWPLVGVLTAGSLLEALRTGSLAWWAAAGGFGAAGVYVYDANNVYLAVLAVYLAGMAVARRSSLRAFLTGVAVMAAVFTLVALPMLRWAAKHPDAYLGHARYNSIFNQPSWKSLHGVGPQARFLARRYVDYWDGLCCHPRLDQPDGTGLTPLAPRMFLGLAGCGIALGLWRRRGPPVTLATTIVLAMPVAFVISEGGLARRGYVALPFLAMLAGVAAEELVSLASERTQWGRVPVALALSAVVGFLAFRGVDDYFGTFGGSQIERVTFSRPLNDAAFFIKKLPPDAHVYFYSAGASVTHETIRFIAPDASAEDRSRQFGGNYSFEVARDGRTPVFVFMDEYEPDVDKVRRLYPGGTTHVVGDAANPELIAYTAPPQR